MALVADAVRPGPGGNQRNQQRQQSRKQREAFEKVRRAERQYMAALRQIGRSVGLLVAGLTVEQITPTLAAAIEKKLQQYAELIEPWARSVAARMLTDVRDRDAKAWKEFTRGMSAGLDREINATPLGLQYRELLDTQVKLITSLPIEAGRRVHELAVQAVTGGKRLDEVIDMIRATGKVTESRAKLIARTEVGRAGAVFTQVRAEHIGSEGYVWRTSLDKAVRADHRALEGTFHRWSEPPISDRAKGIRAHPGCIWNCFIGSTPVSLHRGVRRVFRALYRGELIGVTVGGSELWVTPNHPILTRRGWVAAGLLDKTDELVKFVGEGHEVAQGHHVDHRLITFDQLFEALGPSIRGQQGMFDFYGDPIVDDHVEIVTAPEHLPVDLEAVSLKTIRDQVIAQTDSVIGSFGVVGLASQPFEMNLTSFSNPLQTLLRSSGRSETAVLFELGASLVARALNRCSDDTGASVEVFGDLDAAFARQVTAHDLFGLSSSQGLVSRDLGSPILDAFDEPVRQIELTAKLGNTDALQQAGMYFLPIEGLSVRSNFVGHVYTLESFTGYYQVGFTNITAKNCRCTSEPIIPARFD